MDGLKGEYRNLNELCRPLVVAVLIDDRQSIYYFCALRLFLIGI